MAFQFSRFSFPPLVEIPSRLFCCSFLSHKSDFLDSESLGFPSRLSAYRKQTRPELENKSARKKLYVSLRTGPAEANAPCLAHTFSRNFLARLNCRMHYGNNAGATTSAPSSEIDLLAGSPYCCLPGCVMCPPRDGGWTISNIYPLSVPSLPWEPRYPSTLFYVFD